MIVCRAAAFAFRSRQTDRAAAGRVEHRDRMKSLASKLHRPTGSAALQRALMVVVGPYPTRAIGPRRDIVDANIRVAIPAQAPLPALFTTTSIVRRLRNVHLRRGRAVAVCRVEVTDTNARPTTEEFDDKFPDTFGSTSRRPFYSLNHIPQTCLNSPPSSLSGRRPQAHDRAQKHRYFSSNNRYLWPHLQPPHS